MTQREIGERFGANQQVVSAIVRGTRWAAIMVGEPRKAGGWSGEKSASAKLTAIEVVKIRALAAGGVTQRSIAAMFGMTQANAWAIIHGRTWRT
jgi:hypothetical protein